METINDADGYVSNFWRAVSHAPDEVAHYADWPVNENDMHARHVWLRQYRDELPSMLEGDPEWYDAKIAGWWVYGMSCWIGSGFCGPSGAGPWSVVDGKLVRGAGQGVKRSRVSLTGGRGVARKIVHLGDAGRGVKRQIVHLGDAGRGVKRQIVHLGDAGQGVSRKRVHLGDAGRGVKRQIVHLGDAEPGHECGECGTGACGLYAWFAALQRRLERVRVCCGDYERVLPYGEDAGRDMDIYTEDSGSVASRAREWAIAHGNDPRLRIALCGYAGEHDMPDDWDCVEWKAQGGYSNQARVDRRNGNPHRERIWFSPHCLPADQPQSTLDI